MCVVKYSDILSSPFISESRVPDITEQLVESIIDQGGETRVS